MWFRLLGTHLFHIFVHQSRLWSQEHNFYNKKKKIDKFNYLRNMRFIFAWSLSYYNTNSKKIALYFLHSINDQIMKKCRRIYLNITEHLDEIMRSAAKSQMIKDILIHEFNVWISESYGSICVSEIIQNAIDTLMIERILYTVYFYHSSFTSLAIINKSLRLLYMTCF